MVEPASAIPPFADFYREVHGRDPLPWQDALAAQVRQTGWPSEIGVPTGLGKTAAIDIAVWSLAVSAVEEGRERPAPTRVWYVVNRRLLVDAAFDHGCVLAQLLGDPSAPAAVRSVGRALKDVAAMGRQNAPLHVGLVRGGAPRTGQVPDPSMPALLFATVPMYASRWLFEGYGSSRGNRPIDAALAGTDSLVLLDESHLCRPLRQLADPLAACDPGRDSRLLPHERNRPFFVELTATGADNAFDLTAADHAHPVVRRRLDARKPTTLVATTKRRIAKDLAEQATRLVADNPASSTVVFVNTPARGREVHRQIVAALGRHHIEADPLLLTGRVRELEADAMRRALLDSARGSPAIESPPPRSSPLIVVATQTLEVGADLDFDHLVTETAGPRAIVQRFGRLNRLGVRDADAQAVVCHPTDESESPVYGEQPEHVWAALTTAGAEQELDLGPGRITGLVGPAEERQPRAGEILPSHLWEWVKTTCPPPDRASIEPFIDEVDPNLTTVTVAWRELSASTAQLLEAADDDTASPARLFPRFRAEETIELPLAELREALAARHQEMNVYRLIDDGVLEAVPRDDSGRLRLRPGEQVILPCDAGMADRHGWDPSGTDRVLDLSPLATGVLPLSTDLLANLAGEPPEELVSGIEELLAVDDDTGEPLEPPPKAVALVIAQLKALPFRDAGLRPRWVELVERLDAARVVREPGVLPYLRTVRAEREWFAVSSDALDELSFDASSDDLSQHCGSVADLAAQTGQHLGLSDGLVEILRRGGALHDLGKADPRFQRWLDPDGHHLDRLLAKSSYAPARSETYRIAAGWPRGGRHEALSLRLAEAALQHGPLTEDDELLLHLIASHHGEGRPSIAVTGESTEGTTVAVEYEGHALKVDSDLGRPDWEQPRRFRSMCERYGCWGVALLEAVLRKADHAASGHARRAGSGGAAR